MRSFLAESTLAKTPGQYLAALLYPEMDSCMPNLLFAVAHRMLRIAHGVHSDYSRHGKPMTAQTEALGLTSGSVLHMTPSKSTTNTSDGTAAALALPG